jgi:hypothetical protein
MSWRSWLFPNSPGVQAEKVLHETASARLTANTSACARMSLQARCQCWRSSRFLPMPVM